MIEDKLKFYQNKRGDAMKITSGCIININNNLLLLKHSDGKFSIPEDYIKDNEILKVACIRAMQEITGLNILPNAMFGVYDALDRGYAERTIGVYYITHVDLAQEHIDKLIKEFNEQLKSQNKEYELFMLSLVDVANQEYLYDHKTIMNNYFRILMLGSQTFTNKKASESFESKESKN